MATSNVTFGVRLTGVHFSLDWDPFLKPPQPDVDDHLQEPLYYRQAGLTDGKQGNSNRSNMVPPGMDAAYNEGYKMGKWFYQINHFLN